jgi:nucleotide-binding universal stress UspA family protein
MNRIESILVPIDFGAQSDRAVDYAVNLAEQLGAGVHIISAFELPIASFPDGAYVVSAEMASRLIEASQTALNKACARVEDRKVAVTSHLEQGDPREAILRVAHERKVDLIVMGTHGRKGIARALIGSTAEAVIRASDIPVLTVH